MSSLLVDTPTYLISADCLLWHACSTPLNLFCFLGFLIIYLVPVYVLIAQASPSSPTGYNYPPWLTIQVFYMNASIYIYGLVQAACQYYKKAAEILKSSGFIGGSINPCFYVKKNMKGIVYIAFYVINNLMVGNIATIDTAIESLKSKGLLLKIMERLQDDLSYKIKFSDHKKAAWIGQPHLMKNLESKFGWLVTISRVTRLLVPQSF